LARIIGLLPDVRQYVITLRGRRPEAVMRALADEAAGVPFGPLESECRAGVRAYLDVGQQTLGLIEPEVGEAGPVFDWLARHFKLSRGKLVPPKGADGDVMDLELRATSGPMAGVSYVLEIDLRRPEKVLIRAEGAGGNRTGPLIRSAEAHFGRPVATCARCVCDRGTAERLMASMPRLDLQAQFNRGFTALIPLEPLPDEAAHDPDAWAAAHAETIVGADTVAGLGEALPSLRQARLRLTWACPDWLREPLEGGLTGTGGTPGRQARRAPAGDMGRQPSCSCRPVSAGRRPFAAEGPGASAVKC
jgi:hypothetical protein